VHPAEQLPLPATDAASDEEITRRVAEIDAEFRRLKLEKAAQMERQLPIDKPLFVSMFELVESSNRSDVWM
jgi:hypothetical protein